MGRWIYPSATICAMMLLASILLTGAFYFESFQNWLWRIYYLLLPVGFFLAYRLFRKQKVEGDRLFKAFICLLLGALLISSFSAVKPSLFNRVDFWADPLLTQMDRAFFQTDPAKLLQWLNNEAGAWFYHLGWIASLLLALAFAGSLPETVEKATIIVSFFVLWLLNRLFHFMLPAGGPIFYDLLGLGDDFNFILLTDGSQVARDYLWTTYSSGIARPGGGISAMPSMHVATAIWVALVFWRTPIKWLGALYAVLIFLLSIALGWHYAVDGVGAAIALWIAYRIARFIVKRWPTPEKPRMAAAQ